MRSNNRIEIYDTTLRDGSQGEGINFSLDDKIRISKKLDEFGVDYIEGGWPGSNPKDVEFFERMERERLHHARLAAFGSTRRPNTTADEDENLYKLIAAKTPVVTIFGKSWDMHVTHALRTTMEVNLEMIRDSVKWLVGRVGQVIYDAEHFFDGYKCCREYAISTLKAAESAGASLIVLCDTNGGTLPDEIYDIVTQVIKEIKAPIGIHAHNDCECGVANTLAAVRAGAVHVHGTINGYGERCGNANLVSVIAALRLKMDRECLLPDSLKHLTALSQYVDEVANIPPNSRQAFVGRSAFAHKGGVHIDSVLKHSRTYEHIQPEEVGNSRRMLVSELAGGSTIVSKAQKHELNLAKGSPEIKAILKRVTELENEGYSFEGAEASFELLLKDVTGTDRKLFDIMGFRVIVEKRGQNGVLTEATVKVSVDGVERHSVAEGDGPVHALDSALRRALLEFYPQLANIKLTDFKVRVVNVRDGTAAKVRTIIDSTDGEQTWSTVGVSTNMIEASWHALVESVAYGLMRKEAEPPVNL